MCIWGCLSKCFPLQDDLQNLRGRLSELEAARRGLVVENSRLSCEVDDLRYLLHSGRSAQANFLPDRQEERERRATAERELMRQRAISRRYERFVFPGCACDSLHQDTLTITFRLANEYYHALNDDKSRTGNYRP